MNKKISGRWLRGAFAALLLMVCACFGSTAHAEAQQARNIADLCGYDATTEYGTSNRLWNGVRDSEYKIIGDGRQWLTVDLKGKEAAGIYIEWAQCAAEWTLEAILADGTTEQSAHGQYGILQEYVELPEGTVKFRLITEDGTNAPLRFAELEVYTPGQLPDSVHFWEPTPTTAEIMYIATHQDDELLYFGGAIPYYSGEMEYDSVVVFTAYDNILRLHEALDGLWVCGLKQHPVFLFNEDRHSSTLEFAMKWWDEEKVLNELTELIAEYRPQVVITQDENGEYGHGQHILTVELVKEALVKAADAEYLAERFPSLDPWTVSKCYLHLYGENNISMPWDKMKLESAGGKTALKVAQEAFECHLSQQKFGYTVGTSAEEYDCRSFGLYWTAVGNDVEKNDFFENVTLRYTHVQPPEEEIPEDIERVGEVGWLYRSGEYSTSECMRYCQVNGVAGWYAADETGCLLEPAVRIIPAKDDYSLDISLYETLTLFAEEPPVYQYNDGRSEESVFVRYCSPDGHEADFYAANSDGTLSDPLTIVKVTYNMQQPQVSVDDQPTISAADDGSMRATDVLLVCMCVMLVCAALLMCISVIKLSQKRTRRRTGNYTGNNARR